MYVHKYVYVNIYIYVYVYVYIYSYMYIYVQNEFWEEEGKKLKDQIQELQGTVQSQVHESCHTYMNE